jgi:hypothetical protein
MPQLVTTRRRGPLRRHDTTCQPKAIPATNRDSSAMQSVRITGPVHTGGWLWVHTGDDNHADRQLLDPTQRGAPRRIGPECNDV